MKRAFDLLAAGLGLVVLLPVLLLIGLAMMIFDRGPVFFGQWRVGLYGRPFRMWKFRSMRPQADKQGPAITVGGDSRITPVGRILRKTKLDELPQLWNVVRGEMSLVGPRPEVEKYTSLYSDELKRVLEVKPGITDPASFAFYDEAERLAKVADPEEFYVHVLMPEKIRINLEYAQRRTLLTDFLVILFTVLKPFGFQVNMFSLLKLTPPAH